MKAGGGGIHLVRLNLRPGSLTRVPAFARCQRNAPPQKCRVGFYFVSTATQEDSR